ncbi:MAG TPA: sensor histidine kinase [Nitrososphaera sp.]|jgi:hypothetical protein|nr:sensor histidine kinase [Nitrososphaera sp.]
MSKYFTVEARSILALGRESIKDATTALVELVKNSYDADAENVEIEVYTKTKPSYIRIADNGSGMKKTDVENKWLRIGYSDKSEEDNKTTLKGRRKTGEKGIGRLSADRLGDVLTLHTKVNDETYGLKVNWKKFEKKGLVLHKIPLLEIEQPIIELPLLRGKPSSHGSELIIENLRDDWEKKNIDDLKREISLLISPFKKVSDFEVYLKADVEDVEEGAIQPEVAEEAVITLDARYIERSNKVKYTVDVIGNKDKQDGLITLSQFSTTYLPKPSRTKSNSGNKQKRKLKCGNVRLKLLFFPIKERVFDGISLDKRRIREFININSGIKIYRDDVWVKPYGELHREEWDWLNLGRRYAKNPAGAARASFQIRPQNLVGAIFITRDGNSQLIDSAAREGLIKGDPFNDLKDFAVGCVRLLETEYHQRFDADKKEKEKKLSREVVRISQDASAVLRDMQRIAPMIAKSAIDNVTKDKFEKSIEKIKDITVGLQDTRAALSSIHEQNVIYRGLATIGISTAVFGHEIQTSVTSLVNTTHFIKDYLNSDPPEVKKARQKVEKIIKLANSISTWGKYALTRIQRDKRKQRKENVKAIVARTINDLIPPFETAQIEIRQNLHDVSGVVFAMNVEAILINLLTNAYNACLQETRKRIVRIELEEKWEDERRGFELTVADTGPGVAKEFQERIWTPLFSTKSEGQRNSGTGLGLSIIDSIVNDSSGKRMQDSDPELKGARFRIWLPLSD